MQYAGATSNESTDPYAFGDLLALARLQWVREMERRLRERGFADYRRTDAYLMRLLARGSMSIGRIGEFLGVSRQAARKSVDTLLERGYATCQRDESDLRQVNVALSAHGRRYAEAIGETIDELNTLVSSSVTAEALAVVDSVLRSAIFDPAARARADRLVARPRSSWRPQTADDNLAP